MPPAFAERSLIGDEDDSEDVSEGPVTLEDEDVEDLDAAIAETSAQPSPKRAWNRKLRQVDEHAAANTVTPSWWLGKDREEFARAAAQRAGELHDSPEAARLKPLMNFVGGMP